MVCTVSVVHLKWTVDQKWEFLRPTIIMDANAQLFDLAFVVRIGVCKMPSAEFSFWWFSARAQTCQVLSPDASLLRKHSYSIMLLRSLTNYGDHASAEMCAAYSDVTGTNVVPLHRSDTSCFGLSGMRVQGPNTEWNRKRNALIFKEALKK